MNINHNYLIETIIEKHSENLDLLYYAIKSVDAENLFTSSPEWLYKLFAKNKYTREIKDLEYKEEQFGLYNTDDQNKIDLANLLQTKSLWENINSNVKNSPYTPLNVAFLIHNEFNFTFIKSLFENNSQKAKTYFTEKTWDFRSQSFPQKVPSLHYAVRKNFLSLVKLFCDFGYDINQLDSNGNSPLFYAKSVEILDLLEKYNPDLQIVNKSGLKAAQVVFQNTDQNLQKCSIWNSDRDSAVSILQKSFKYENVSHFKEKFKQLKNIIKIQEDGNQIVKDIDSVSTSSGQQKIVFLLKNGLNVKQKIKIIKKLSEDNEEQNEIYEAELLNAILANFYLKNSAAANIEIYNKTLIFLKDYIHDNLKKQFDEQLVAQEIGEILMTKDVFSYPKITLAEEYLNKLGSLDFQGPNGKALFYFEKLLNKQLKRSNFDYLNCLPKNLLPWAKITLEDKDYDNASIGFIWHAAYLLVSRNPVDRDFEQNLNFVIQSPESLEKLETVLEYVNNWALKQKDKHVMTYLKENAFYNNINTIIEAKRLIFSNDNQLNKKLKIL